MHKWGCENNCSKSSGWVPHAAHGGPMGFWPALRPLIIMSLVFFSTILKAF